MTYSVAERSLNRSFDFAKVRPEKSDELSKKIWDSAGTRRAVISVSRTTGPPIEVEIWLEHEDRRLKVLWLRHGDFPDNVISQKEMAIIRTALDVYFERQDRRNN